MRKILNLNQNWQFALQKPGMEKEGLVFTQVTLPHDWMISCPFDRNMKQGEAQGFFDRWGTGWYRRTLLLEKKPETVYRLRFDGVYENSRVTVNGTYVGGRKYGYSTFTLDVTDALADGENEILVEGDNTQRTHFTIGELAVSTLHPKQIIPQDGVYTGIEDMDYIILKIPQTKEYIRRRYDVDVSDESEEEPDIKGTGGDTTANDLVTQYIAYYRNDKGGIGLYSWVNDTQLEDLEDYQARRLRRCVKCGAVEPLLTEPEMDAPDILLPNGMSAAS